MRLLHGRKHRCMRLRAIDEKLDAVPAHEWRFGPRIGLCQVMGEELRRVAALLRRLGACARPTRRLQAPNLHPAKAGDCAGNEETERYRARAEPGHRHYREAYLTRMSLRTERTPLTFLAA